MKFDETRAQALSLMRGAYDLHMHPAPSHTRRIADDFEAARQANEVHMAGLVIKNHYEPTAARAAIANKYAQTETRLYGSIALNYPEGGLNPYAVESALNLGARYVWMPTHDSAQSMKFPRMPWEFFDKPCGISIFDENGAIKKEVGEILEIVCSYNAVVATGHLSVEESVALCHLALDQKVKVVLTHPDWEKTKVPLEVQIDLARKGVYVEKCWVNVIGKNVSLEEMLESIKAIGAERTFISTDLALVGFCRAVDGYCDFVYNLLKAGFSPAQVKNMTATIPAYLLGVDSEV